MADKPVSKRARKRALVRKYILAHPTEQSKAVAEDCQVSVGTVSIVRRELIAEGSIKRSPDDQSMNRVYTRPTQPSPEPLMPPQVVLPQSNEDELIVQGTRTILELAAKSGHDISKGDVSPEEMIGIYTEYMRDNTQIAAVRFAAISGINKLKSEMVGRDALGPGEPLTVEDQILRLHFLLKAVGLTNSMKAFEMAFKKKETESEQTATTSEQSDDVGATTQTIEATNDDNPVQEA
jgi:hypothetical protein